MQIRATLPFLQAVGLCAVLACSDDANSFPATGLADARVAPGTDGRVSSGPEDASTSTSAASDAAQVDPATSDAGTDAQAAVTEGSARQACIAYTTAWCERIAHCTSTTEYDRCMDRADYCPDLLFAQGSSNTAAAMLACAAGWKQISCSQLYSGVFPPCARPGTFADGQECLYPSQCSSHSCSGQFGTCGVCLERVPAGGACGTDKPCEQGYQCNSGVCSEPAPHALELGFAGEPCSLNRFSCVYGTTCVQDASSPMGGRCMEKSTGSSCTGDDCPADSFCHAPTNTCQKLPTMGEACSSGRGFYDEDCAAGLRCSVNKCVPRGTLGDDCSFSASECLEGLVCAAKSPTQNQCRRERQEGESCTDALDTCVYGTMCIGGSCMSASQGTFEQSCL